MLPAAHVARPAPVLRCSLRIAVSLLPQIVWQRQLHLRGLVPAAHPPTAWKGLASLAHSLVDWRAGLLRLLSVELHNGPAVLVATRRVGLPMRSGDPGSSPQD